MPSAKILSAKQKQVDELSEKVKASAAGVVVDYSKTKVEDDTKLRKELREAGVDYKVLKNTTLRFVFNNAGLSAMNDTLDGMTAFAVSKEDPVAAAKILAKFAKDHENFKIKAGYVDGEVLDLEGLKALSEIPSKEVLIGKMLGSLQHSLYGLAYVLQAKIDKENEAAPAEETAEA